jgi:magnesium-transporting ATPase (P-type)
LPVLDFFKALAVCHTVVCDSEYEYTDENPIPTYQASSPDELALVQGASSVGIIFKSRAHSILTLQNMNSVPFQEETFRVLAEFPFDSTRKCMSVLLQDEYTQRFYLYTKGADNVMLDKFTFAAGSSLKTQIIGDLYSYSCQGFRTLVIGMKEISAGDYARFEKLHTSLQSSTSEFKDRQLTQLYQKMEQNILYLGSTAIEDKLQEGVPETIANILAAEIRFWVLTGDKLVSL